MFRGNIDGWLRVSELSNIRPSLDQPVYCTVTTSFSDGFSPLSPALMTREMRPDGLFTASAGGTFTITNGGVFGSLLSTPILNPPQVAILGLHKIQERPVAIAGKLEIRPMMYIALSYDHRIVDGREAVQFLVKIKEYIEDPGQLLIES